MEAVISGVPMYFSSFSEKPGSCAHTRYSRICWPYLAEQPQNTAHLTDTLQLGYELVEIRTGEYATKPICRTGKTPRGSIEALRAEALEILDKAFGADGQIKRANVLKLREESLAAIGPGGSSQKDIQRLLEAMSI